MDDKKLILFFLRTIRRVNDTSSLYSIYGAYRMDINKVFKFSLNEGYVHSTSNDIIITEKGIDKISELTKELELQGIDKFIMPNALREKESIKIDTIYVP